MARMEPGHIHPPNVVYSPVCDGCKADWNLAPNRFDAMTEHHPPLVFFGLRFVHVGWESAKPYHGVTVHRYVPAGKNLQDAFGPWTPLYRVDQPQGEEA